MLNKLIIVIHNQTGTDVGLRLDKWLLKRSKLPWGLINKFVRQGKFFSQGQKLQRAYRLQENDTIEFPITFSLTNPIIPQSGLKGTFDNWVIYSDTNIIAINKPAGIACQGGSGVKLSIDTLASEFYNAKLMHRIDRLVSGLLILGKTSQACSIPLSNKIYYAILIGFPPDSGEITDKIMNCGDRQKVTKQGKDAKTNYERIETVEVDGIKYSLVKVWISSGRKHQIRVHCASSLGMPVLGDEKYGGGVKERIYLHAYQCSVGQNLITAPLAKCFVQMMDTLRFTSEIV